MSNRPRDPWADVKTINGLAADEVISTLQKSIRRGMMENALLVAQEMSATSPEMEEFLWARLTVIAVEDVGLGSRDMPLLVEALYQQHLRFPYGAHDRFLFAAHAIRILATSQKDRTSDELTNWTKGAAKAGQLPDVPDFAIDMHTRRGQSLGRDDIHFLTEASRVENEIPNRDRTYLDRVINMKKSQ